MNKISLDSDFRKLRQVRAQLTWLMHTRPDICIDANKLAQVTENNFKIQDVKYYNKIVDYLKSTNERTLKMKKLDLNSLHIRAYSDASFANKL